MSNEYGFQRPETTPSQPKAQPEEPDRTSRLLEAAFTWLDAVRGRFERHYKINPERLKVDGNAIVAFDRNGRTAKMAVPPVLLPIFEAVSVMTDEGANFGNLHLHGAILIGKVPRQSTVSVKSTIIEKLEKNHGNLQVRQRD